MAIELGTPDVDGLGEVVAAMREWQVEGAPIQLHPGDLGWFWRFGAEATAAATRTWTRAAGSSPRVCLTVRSSCG